MIIFKMEDDKTLLMTHGILLNQYEHRSDNLVFYIPQTIDEINPLDYSVSLRCTLPGGDGGSIFLSKKDDLYNGYLQYFCPITISMAAEAGVVQLCLSFVDVNNVAVMRSSVATMQVLPSIGSGEAVEADQMDQLDWLMMQIKKLDEEKADDIIINEEEEYMQLVSNDEPIGSQISTEDFGIPFEPDDTLILDCGTASELA